MTMAHAAAEPYRRALAMVGDSEIRVDGICHPRFTAVADAFADNFTTHNEAGASVSVVHDGRVVVDLWGGIADPATGRAWAPDTVVVVFSATKGATALCLHLLAARGQLDLDAPIADVWPDFAAHGKGRATARMILDHSIGLPVIRARLKVDCLTDPDYMVAHLADETPFWEPGTRTGYHPLTMGFLAGELIRRVDGRGLGEFFADEIAGPLGLDFWIGLPEAREPRVAPVIVHRPVRDVPPSPFLMAAREAGSIQNLFVFNHGDWSARGVNTRAGRAAVIGAASGVTNARGLAGMYAALLAPAGDPLGIGAGRIARFADPMGATQMDATLLQPTCFGPGFMLRMDNRGRPGNPDSLIVGRAAFGHVGAGGSVGFADPDRGLAFGYAMTRMGPGLLLNPRGQSLVDAAYRCL
ncbi:serine hydrolase [Tistrella bauzanensis]|uniref:serine hydrolase domain-containing protein n=1 Tax=Tistrella TaxID=171436 RepID=UPI0031F67FE4